MKKLSILIILTTMVVVSIQAQTMYLHKTSGDVEEFAIADIDSISFSDSQISSSSSDDSGDISSSSVISFDPSDYDLDVTKAPGQNFDLAAWKITFPDASEEEEDWMPTGVKDDIFYTDPETGGMVFYCPNQGSTTSGSTKYSRTELREMIREGDTEIGTKDDGNSWFLSGSDQSSMDLPDGVSPAINGTLSATLRVDHVSTTFDYDEEEEINSEYMLGRVIVGQIHASEDEPCRLYYRKLPGNTKGSIYFAYEPPEDVGDEEFHEIIGSKSDDAEDPADGIELGEVWSYVIDIHPGADDPSVDQLVVTIKREGKADVVSTPITVTSEFNNDPMYFKAGVYNQNNGGDTGDYAQATFFALTHEHD